MKNIVNPMFVVRKVHPKLNGPSHTVHAMFSTFDAAHGYVNKHNDAGKGDYVVFACQPIYDTRDREEAA